MNGKTPLNRRKFLHMSAGLTGLAATLAACGGGSAAPTTQAPDAPAASGGAVDKGKLAATLSWYTWGGYTSEAILKKFTDEFGPIIKVDTYGSNEEMEAKFKAGGNPGYDLITPSDYMVSKMAAAGLLEKIDFANIPNYANLGAGHKGLYFDPNNEYSVAYNWGVTGLAYNKTKVKEPITNWGQVMAWPAELKGKVSLLDDQRELLGMALRFKNFSGNSAKAEEIEAAKQALIELKKSANYVLSDSPGGSTNLVAGDVVAAMMYTNDANVARSQNPDIVFVIPEPVSTVWQDNSCVPTGAPSKYTAEVFINWLCRPEIAAEFATNEETLLTTPNAEALSKGLVDKAKADDKTVYPDVAAMGSKLDYLKKGDPAIEELYQRAFDEVKAA
jgi:spermidine/putrescine transport system substrate-binding protein